MLKIINKNKYKDFINIKLKIYNYNLLLNKIKYISREEINKNKYNSVPKKTLYDIIHMIEKFEKGIDYVKDKR